MLFQCSSASRKFLNYAPRRAATTDRAFSALQRAENSSIRRNPRAGSARTDLSVLFSEPKIPQYECRLREMPAPQPFSALQRAENSSMLIIIDEIEQVLTFSALQRAENSSI